MGDNSGRLAGPVRDFGQGVRYFGQGLAMLVRRPRLLLTGMLPAVLTTVLLLAGFAALLANIGELSALVTPFANGWAEDWRVAARVAVGITMAGGAVLLGLVGFTALTLVIGGPFYEHIAERIELDLDAATGASGPRWWKMTLITARDGVRLTLRSLLFTIVLAGAGFIPGVGQTVVPVLVVLVTAWFLALEAVALPFYRRGIDLRGRREALRPRRMLALGLGVPAALLSLIPLMTIIVMPVVCAGGVLVALDALGLLRPGARPAADVSPR